MNENSAASRVVLAPYGERETIQAAREALLEVGGHTTCAFLFATPDYREHLADFTELIQLHAHAPIVACCSGATIIGSALEAEGQSGFSLLLLNLPNTKVHAVALSDEILEQAEDASTPEEWHSITGVKPSEVDAWIALTSPSYPAAEGWLEAWNEAYPGIPTIGGLASGGSDPDETFILKERTLMSGALLLGFQGGVKISTIVSQGCRPVGDAHMVTGAQDHFVTSLDAEPAYKVLDRTFGALPVSDKKRAQGNLFVGLATSDEAEEFHTGDFLVRNLLGADPQNGVLAVGALPRVGQTLQFQIRDAASADTELRQLCADARKTANPFASLVFACGGRGQRMFGMPHHDAGVISETFGPHPSAGFFCNGEIGPVAGRNFLHGYTASVALFH